MNLEEFNEIFSRRNPKKGGTEKRPSTDILDSGSQEGSPETTGDKTKTPSSKSDLTDFKKLFLIGGVGAITAIVAGAVVKIIRKDDSDKL